MHGLMLKALQGLITDTHGLHAWHSIIRHARLESTEFESMLSYDDTCADAILTGAALQLNRKRCDILEDVGTYLVSHPRLERLRRLLRFGGVDFTDFLYSIEDLPGRGRLAVTDLDLPHMDLRDCGEGRFTLRISGPVPGLSFVLAGLLRALADDYGVLVLIDDPDPPADAWLLGPHRETLTIRVLDDGFAAGRQFQLGVAML